MNTKIVNDYLKNTLLLDKYPEVFNTDTKLMDWIKLYKTI